MEKYFKEVKCPNCKRLIPFFGNFCPICRQKFTQKCPSCGKTELKGAMCEDKVRRIAQDWKDKKAIVNKKLNTVKAFFLFPWFFLSLFCASCMFVVPYRYTVVMLVVIALLSVGLYIIICKQPKKKIEKAKIEFCAGRKKMLEPIVNVVESGEM